MAQAIPGPNMILMMGLIGWKVWGLAGALATATFAPPCAIYFAAFRLMRRFQEARWQRVMRSALIPVTTGLIIASGLVMAQAAGITWAAIAVALKFSACMTARKAIRNPNTQQKTISTIASVGPKHPSPKRPRPSAICAHITHSSI
jgi:chromate transporter